MRSWLTKIQNKGQALAAKPYQRLVWNIAAALDGGLLTAIMAALITASGFPAEAGPRFAAVLWTALFVAMLSLILGGLLGRLAWGYLISALSALGLTIVNHYKMLITGVALELHELALVTKVGAIAELNAASIRVTGVIVAAILTMLLWFAGLLVFAKPVLNLSGRWRWSAFAGALAAFLLIFALLAEPLLYRPADATLSERRPQIQVYDRCLVPLGLWRTVLFRDNQELLDLTDPDAMQDMMESLDGKEEELPPEEIVPEEPPAPPVQPNIIMVLSESFFNVTDLPGVTFENDPLADFHALQAESVSGRFFSRALGYGTCNVELEIFTGIHRALLGESDDPLNWDPADISVFPTVPELLVQDGYYTALTHMYNDSIYNRSSVFSCLGFDEMNFDGDFAAIDPEAAAAGEDYRKYLWGKISGDYYGDDYMAELIFDLYEREKDNGPVFLYTSSMENHTPYTADKYSTYEFPFTTETELSAQANGVLNSYVQGAANSSKALRKMVDYFSTVEEPTVVVFFGDHVPGLGLDKGSVYTELGIYNGYTYSLEPEAAADLYAADYLIWANDAALLPAEPGSVQDTSSGLMGLNLLKLAGTKLPRFWKLVEKMAEECVAYNQIYFVDREGDADWQLPEDVNRAPFSQMTSALADARGERQLTEWFCQVAK